MPSHPLCRRMIIVGTAAALTCWGSVAVAAADPKPGNGQGNGQSQSQNNGNAGNNANGANSGNAGKPGNGQGNGQGNGNGNGQAHGNNNAHGTATAPGQNKPPTSRPGNSAQHGAANAPGQVKQGNGSGSGGHDPAGNNGTIKITPLGEQDGTPDNNPHVTCGFQIEWYGFDRGNYYSQVSFAMQAPTKDATITPNGPTSVFVGGDAASGAGTATGLDARASYYPTFTGTPHPKQGFHVKVTVATPFSQGNDTKTKVFWVQPCAAGTPGGGTPGGGTPGGGTPGVGAPGGPTVAGPNGGTPETTGTPVTSFVRAAGAPVPTVVDAGQDGGPSLFERVRSPLPLLLMAGALAALALWSLRRARADN